MKIWQRTCNRNVGGLLCRDGGWRRRAAPKPKISNAKVQQLSASAGLKATVDGLVQKQTAPLWIGYRIPTAAKERTMCCFDSLDNFEAAANKCCMGCRMESEKGSSFNGTNSNCSPPEAFAVCVYFLPGGSKSRS